MKKDEDFKPYVSEKEDMREFTLRSVILGLLLAVVFGGANAYLGLRVGLTVSASVPAAVISMGVLRFLFKNSTILENNIVQTIGSAGESAAAGSVFTLPALFMWAEEWGDKPPSIWEIFIIALFGGLLGVLFMVPLRRALIVREHKTLKFPEGTACSEVLLAGEKKGLSAALVFFGFIASAVYKFIGDGLKLFPTEIHWEGKGRGFGIDVLPALLGVGFICGSKISFVMLSGGITAWLVFMPLIYFFGANSLVFPGEVPVSAMDSFSLWSCYIRYIGAGAVAAAGIISLIKSLPVIFSAFSSSLKAQNTEAGENEGRTSRDLSMKFILISAAVIIVLIWLVPVIPVNFVSAVLIALFGFFFTVVSARLVGLVGSSNNPTSGMTIAALLTAALVLKFTGQEGRTAMVSAMVIGSVICIITSVAGDTSQDLKTGYILGATPRRQQTGEILGVVITSLTIGGVLYLLNSAWGYGSAELPAPQATLMKLVVEGVTENNLPGTLIYAGVFTAIAMELLGIPALPFCVGLYLPIHLSAAIAAGGLLRLIFEKRKNLSAERGVLIMSGMIAGEGIVGIILALFAVIPLGSGTLGSFADISSYMNLGAAGSVIFFILLIFAVIVKSKEDKG